MPSVMIILLFLPLAFGIGFVVGVVTTKGSFRRGFLVRTEKGSLHAVSGDGLVQMEITNEVPAP